MKLLKLSLAAAMAALVVGPGTAAHANLVTDGTYTFQASPTETLKSLDGSTVTFVSDAIVSWDLMDSAAPAAGFVPLTPANSSIISSGVLGANAWFFSIGSPSGTPSTDASTFWFEGQNNLEGDLGGGAFGSLFDKTGDPIGNWGLASVPDATGTFQLFVGALTALGTYKAFFRGRAASPR